MNMHKCSKVMIINYEIRKEGKWIKLRNTESIESIGYMFDADKNEKGRRTRKYYITKE